MNSPYDIETIKLIDGKISHKRNIHPFNEFNYNCISILINLNNIKNKKKFNSIFSINKNNMLQYLLMNAWRFPIIKRAWVLPKMSADSFKRDLNDNRPIVLCCGDSITHGHIGYDWVGSLRDKDSSKIYINAGINADLTWNLNQRVDDILSLIHI